MTAAAIFAASFIVVFALGIQQLNVNEDKRIGAFITSLVIGAATLVQLKLLPGPTTWLDIAAYLLGSAIGIVSAMAAYPRLFAKIAGADEPAPTATRLSESVRLAMVIADSSARADIESFCKSERIGAVTWWDTASTHFADELDRQYVSNAVAYLHLRQKVRLHESRPHLLAFL